MRISVCGIACEFCPNMTENNCPNGETGCIPKENKFCKIASCAFKKGIHYCFKCNDFPCEITKKGPISYEYTKYIAGK